MLDLLGRFVCVHGISDQITEQISQKYDTCSLEKGSQSIKGCHGNRILFRKKSRGFSRNGGCFLRSGGNCAGETFGGSTWGIITYPKEGFRQTTKSVFDVERNKA